MQNKLTKQQRATLQEVARLTDMGSHANAYRNRLSRGVLLRLEKAGFIHSVKPFAGSYHTTTITAAGRAALEASDDQ